MRVPDYGQIWFPEQEASGPVRVLMRDGKPCNEVIALPAEASQASWRKHGDYNRMRRRDTIGPMDTLRISFLRNGERVGAQLNAPGLSSPITSWAAGHGTSAPTAAGEAVRGLATEIDGLPHGQYKAIFGALPQTSETERAKGA